MSGWWLACFGIVSDLVDEAHGGREVGEFVLLHEFAGFKSPSGEGCDRLLQFLAGQCRHGAPLELIVECIEHSLRVLLPVRE